MQVWKVLFVIDGCCCIGMLAKKLIFSQKCMVIIALNKNPHLKFDLTSASFYMWFHGENPQFCVPEALEFLTYLKHVLAWNF
jgi:hypothetical protein